MDSVFLFRYLLIVCPLFLLLLIVDRERRFYEYGGHQIEVFNSVANHWIKIDGKIAAQARTSFIFSRTAFITMEASLDNMHVLVTTSLFWWGNRIKTRINGRLIKDIKKRTKSLD